MFMVCTGKYYGIEVFIVEGSSLTTIELREGCFVTIAQRKLLRRLARRINATRHAIILEG